jgi:rod shape-determining protein MreD
MRRILQAGLAVVAAFVLHSLLAQISFSLPLVLNVFSMVVVLFAVREGEIFGMILGMACGLIWDTFSLGVFGLAGIAKMMTGYIAGTIPRRIDVSSMSRSLIFFALLFSLELLIWIALYRVVFGQPLSFGRGLLAFQPFVTAIAACGSSAVLRHWERKRSISS